MADPRFYENRGPFSLAEICVKAGIALPDGADGAAMVSDLASLDGAGPRHLSFFAGGKTNTAAFARAKAGFCFVPETEKASAPAGMTQLPCASVSHAFAHAAELFYPGAGLGVWAQDLPVHPSATIGARVTLGPGVVIGPGAQIGDGSIIGAYAVIGPGVAIGRNCEIGSHVSLSHAYLGDRVVVLPGARIGQPGFGFASSEKGHVKIPQLGRVVIQDAVEIGAGTTIDRGALGDTVIGEGTKIDNLVQVGHNVQIGRHCILVSQVGIGGSSQLEDFVVLSGQVGIADHAHVGAGARLAARGGIMAGQSLEGARDYGGVPAKPVRDWFREIHAVSRLARGRKQDDHE